MGYELVGIEFHFHDTNALLRVYIDKETGVNVADCQQVSYQISGLLDVEDPIPGHYILEVSSPGLDRPLFESEHFRRFAGQQVRVNLAMPLNGRRKLQGLLQGMQNNDVVLSINGETLLVPLEHIEKARLIPEF
jgi:ribosome maturation factor RimP